VRPDHQPACVAAVVFDFDGTLTRPGEIDFAGIRRELGCPVGTPILEYVHNLPGDRADPESVLDRYEMEAAERAEPNVGAEDLVLALVEHGLPLAILTRNMRRAVVRSLENFPRLGPEHFVAMIARDDDIRPKPDPEGIFRLASMLRVSVPSILCVGDYDFDVEIARRAGCLSAFLTNGQAMTTTHPDYTIDRLDEVLAIVVGDACNH